jgi:ribose transport system substrate-binding protein
MSNGELVRDITRAELDAATAGADDPVERLQLAERQLQLALQHRAQQFTRPMGKGPSGEESEVAANVQLTEEELARIRGMNAKAAIVLHYGGNDWSRAQVEGLTAQFGAMGVEVAAVTDAGFDPARQVADIEAVVANKPDVIVSIPTDQAATAAAYRAAAAQGVKLVFMDNVPAGMVAGRDYVGSVSADNYAGGVAAAQMMAEALGGAGEIGLIGHEADFFVTRQRHAAFKKAVADHHSGVRIVAERRVAGPDFAAGARAVAAEMLAGHPGLRAIWVVWDVPAEGVMEAAREVGRDDLVIVTHDLGEAVALEMARGGMVKGLVAQRPYDQGVIEALLAGYALLGKAPPRYVALPAIPVTRASLLDAWQIVYRRPPPAGLGPT